MGIRLGREHADGRRARGEAQESESDVRRNCVPWTNRSDDADPGTREGQKASCALCVCLCVCTRVFGVSVALSWETEDLRARPRQSFESPLLYALLLPFPPLRSLLSSVCSSPREGRRSYTSISSSIVVPRFGPTSFFCRHLQLLDPDVGAGGAWSATLRLVCKTCTRVARPGQVPAAQRLRLDNSHQPPPRSTHRAPRTTGRRWTSRLPQQRDRATSSARSSTRRTDPHRTSPRHLSSF